MSSRDLAASLDRPSSAGCDARASYLSELDRRPPLPRELERRLVTAAKRGDAEARVRLVDAFLPLVVSIARLGLGERRVREIERRARNKLRVAARGGGDGDGGEWAA